MFAGGGLSWLESREGGEFALAAGAAGRAARSFRPFLPLGRRAGQARPHPLVSSRREATILAIGALVEEVVADGAGGRRRAGGRMTLGSLAAGNAAKAVQLEAAALAPSGFARAQAAAGIVA